MADQEEPKLEEEVVVQPEAEQPLEETVEEPEEPESPEAPSEDAEETSEEAEEQPKISRRESLRVQELLKKYGPPPAAPVVKTPDFREKVQADEDTYKTLEETTKDFGRDLIAEATARSNFNTWNRFLSIDDATVRQAYPELDKDNKERFYPALADALNVKYLRTVGFNPGDPEKGVPPSVANPDLSYREFVEAEMEFANELANMKVSRSQQNIVKQAANTALRPDGSTPKRMNLSKPPEQMTDDELKAVIAQSGL